jgi:hypothetical protein
MDEFSRRCTLVAALTCFALLVGTSCLGQDRSETGRNSRTRARTLDELFLFPNVAEISGRKSLNNLQHSLLEVFPCTEC